MEFKGIKRGSYTSGRRESAIDVEETDCVLDGPLVEGWVDARCFGHDCGAGTFHLGSIDRWHDSEIRRWAGGANIGNG